jgi:hypothetical protein
MYAQHASRPNEFALIIGKAAPIQGKRSPEVAQNRADAGNGGQWRIGQLFRAMGKNDGELSPVWRQR